MKSAVQFLAGVEWEDVGDLRHPHWWMKEGFGIAESDAGIDVSEEKALTLSAYWACGKVISEDIAKLPFNVYERVVPRGRILLRDDPVHRLLNVQPNPETTAVSFRETVTSWAVFYGNGYAWIKRDGTRPESLWQVHPRNVLEIVRVEPGEIWYKVQNPPNTVDEHGRPIPWVLIPAEDMLHVRGLGGDGLNGWSVLRYSVQSLGLALAADKYGATFFRKGARPSGLLMHPETIDEEIEENIRAGWNKIYSGSGNTGQVAILGEGLEYKQLGIPNNEAQFLETRQFQIEEIARWFRVSPVKIGHNQNVPFANIEAINMMHDNDALMGWARRWEAETDIKLLGQGSGKEAEHQFSAGLRGDSNSRANYFQKAIFSGRMTPNESRELDGLSPRGPVGGPADQLYMQASMVPIASLSGGSSASTPNAPAPEDRGEDVSEENSVEGRSPVDFRSYAEGLRPMFEDAAERVVRKETIALKRNARKYQGDPDGMAKWILRFYGEQEQYICNAFDAPAMALSSGAARVGLDGCHSQVTDIVSREAHDSISKRTAEVAKSFVDATIDQYANEIEDFGASELAERILIAATDEIVGTNQEI